MKKDKYENEEQERQFLELNRYNGVDPEEWKKTAQGALFAAVVGALFIGTIWWLSGAW